LLTHGNQLQRDTQKPGYFFPCDGSILEVAEQVHLAEDAALVEEQFVVTQLFVVVVLVVFGLAQLTAARRQQLTCLAATHTQEIDVRPTASPRPHGSNCGFWRPRAPESAAAAMPHASPS